MMKTLLELKWWQNIFPAAKASQKNITSLESYISLKSSSFILIYLTTIVKVRVNAFTATDLLDYHGEGKGKCQDN